jgi:hypothetical protein
VLQPIRFTHSLFATLVKLFEKLRETFGNGNMLYIPEALSEDRSNLTIASGFF